MKKIKFLLACVIVVTMLSSVAMAAMTLGVDGATGTTINYTDGNLVLTIKPSETANVYGIGLTVYFDGTVWENTDANAASSSAYTGGMSGAQNAGTTNATVTYTNTGYVGDITPDKALVSFTFALREGKSANNTTFTVESSCIDGIGYIDVVGGTTTYTVAAGGQEETVTATNAGAAYETVFGEENSYWGVWVGSYKVTPGTKTMKKVSVAFTNSGHDAFEQDGLSITGSGEVTFKVAIVGVPETYKDASVATVTLQ